MSVNGLKVVNGDHFQKKYHTGMETTGYKVFNDSVHGHITLHPLLVKVVDTQEFQRLRNLKQLGVANYVFPGASHCRYEHSLGTCYLAGQMVEKLLDRDENTRSEKEKEKLTLMVQLAALCHDLGHGPFSHTWEHVISKWGGDWKHEQASVQMFDYLIRENSLEDDFKKYGLEECDQLTIKQLIMGGPYDHNATSLNPKDNFLYEIVSNKETGIDVDKWDYFLRDGLHLNLTITFDYRRLLEFCIVENRKEDGCTHISFRDKEIMNLYDMFRVRSALHHTAYRHQVVLSIELMVIDAFEAAGNAGYKLNQQINLKKAHENPDHMRELTDHIFYDILYSRDDAFKYSRNLLQRILKRKLYKFVGKANIQFHNIMEKEDRQKYLKTQKKKLEDTLNESYSETPQFRIAVFYLDLDSQNDPVSKVRFYKKEKDHIRSVPFQEIRDLLYPFPFQLTKAPTAVLSVFCANEKVCLQDAQNIIKNYKPN